MLSIRSAGELNGDAPLRILHDVGEVCLGRGDFQAWLGKEAAGLAYSVARVKPCTEAGARGRRRGRTACVCVCGGGGEDYGKMQLISLIFNTSAQYPVRS